VLGNLEDKLKLPEGRAAYSVRTLRRLTQRMLSSGDDLHAARKAVFGVPDDWQPSASPIGEPVGNPAVDRVLKIVNRYLAACERQWGLPQSVNIEHTRNGLISEKQAGKIDRENQQRYQANQELRGEIAQYLNSQGDAVRQGGDDSFVENPESPVNGLAIGQRRSDIDRWRALTRQGSACLYCGATLRWETLEMDHIVPRAGAGATNTQVNLAAVCRECNHSKGKDAFAVWVRSGKRPQASLLDALARVDGFQFFGLESRDRRYQSRFKRDVKDRLRRTEADDPIDNRSIESVGWMANELRHRIDAHYKQLHRQGSTQGDTRVGVFRGWVTSESRRAAGIDKRLLLIGGHPGKNRLDRRHHAVDAATIAMIRQGAAQSLATQNQVLRANEWADAKQTARDQGMRDWDLAQVLAIRDNLHRVNQLDGRLAIDWKDYKGANPDLFDCWRQQMVLLADLIQAALDRDQVPVFELLRLRVGSSRAHEDTVNKLAQVAVSQAMSTELIDRSATPAQWVALTRQPDFDPREGLPSDPSRRVRIHQDWFTGADKLGFFKTGSGCLAVRGGYVELGSSFHHARIYRCVKRLSSGKTSLFYGQLRVYASDLIEFGGRSEDVFHIDLPPQAISWRTADSALRRAVAAGDAEYIDWLVPGDELELSIPGGKTDAIGVFLGQFPETKRWVVQSLKAPTKLHLRPRQLSGEGAEAEDLTTSASALVAVPKSTKAILCEGNGFVPAINVLFGQYHPRIIRRDILGHVRLSSTAHLPVSWSLESIDDGGGEGITLE
jgi:CRISPR-associated endonuclease Csn1